jgi:hypothetical protein
VHGARQAVLTQVFAGFFKGLVPSLLASIPTQVIYYGSYEYSRHLLGRSLGTQSDMNGTFASTPRSTR